MENFKKGIAIAAVSVCMLMGLINVALANGTITGTVYQIDGTTPIIGINVWADGSGVETVTGPLGFYSLTVPAGSYKIGAAGGSSGYVMEFYNGTLYGTPYGNDATMVSVPASGINFRLEVSGSISGTVRIMSEAGLKDVTVYASNIDGGIGSNATTDVNGKYTITGLSSGTYYIYSQLSGYGTAFANGISVTAPDPTTAPDLYMSATPGTISGLVSIGGNPAFGVQVNVMIQEGDRWYWINKNTTTNSSSPYNYSIPDLNPRSDYVVQTQQVTIDEKTYPQKQQENIAVTEGSTTYVNFALQEGARIYGVVSDGTDPVADVDVNCGREGWGTGTETDINGEYELYVLPDSNYIYELKFDPPDNTDYIIQQLTVAASTAGDYERNVTLESGAIVISGQVTVADSDPLETLENIRISYWNNVEQISAQGYTDSNGDYTLHNLPKGKAEVRAEPEHTYAAQGIEQDFDEDTPDIDFALVEESTLSGIVRDASTGAPLENIRITYENEGQAIWVERYSDSQGEFSFAGLPAGIAEVYAHPEPGVQYGGNYYAWKGGYIYLSLGEHRENYEIKLEQGALISGYVKDATPQENPISGIELWADKENGEEICWVDTDVNGNYEMRFAPGRYVVALNEDAGYAAIPQIVDVSSPTDDHPNVNFTAYDETTGATIIGTITNSGFNIQEGSGLMVSAFEGGQEINIDNFRLTSSLSMETLGNFGPYSVIVLPAGNFDIHFCLFNEGQGNVESMTVRESLFSVPANSTNQDFAYDSEGSTVTGTVTANGEPVLMATVFLADSAGHFAGFADTNQNGTYFFYNVPTGNYTVQATAHEYGKSTQASASVPADGETVSGVNIQFGSLPSIITANLDGDDKDDLVIDFGEDWGIWVRYGTGDWDRYNTLTAKSIVTAKLDADALDDLVIDFGEDRGIWVRYGTGDWDRYNTLTTY